MGSQVIQSRADFFRILDEALKEVAVRIPKIPGFEPLESIELQLDAMKRWTVNGRVPTEDERHWVDIGVITIRELEPAEDTADASFFTKLHELNYYFENWPDDPDVAAEDPPL
jgi:hypothetical protein